MRRVLLALIAAGFVAGLAVPSFAQSGPIAQPVHVWFLADGGMCVQVEDQTPICSHPQPM